MDQNNNPPVNAAGIDPAFVPGLTPPRPAQAAERATGPADAAPDAAPDADPAAEPKAEAETEAAVADNEPQPRSDGPVFKQWATELDTALDSYFEDTTTTTS
ncbi:hypothetical protein [Streptomyces rectiverticillatus]|uniref:hypothetical protein n=1 Tax=Streptomyces rectiverticillatus TaxID=173860 RepID=UPI001FE6D45A|nr:hypothetical protein [Streptomyces rectiverticillatus]